jgi:hypothetical protein
VNGGVSEEATLAQDVIAKILAWAERKSRTPRGNPLPRLAIKFCGGCNPTIERGQLARIIRQGLADGVRWVSAEEEVDLLLIICGCLTACADRTEVKEKAVQSLAIAGPTISMIQRKKNRGKEPSGNSSPGSAKRDL